MNDKTMIFENRQNSEKEHNKDKRLLLDTHFNALIEMKNRIFEETGITLPIRTLIKHILDKTDFNAIQEKLIQACFIINNQKL